MSPILKILFQIFIILALLPLFVVVYFIIIILTLPYTLFYFSSNWSIGPKDSLLVEVYLRHFERLYTNLITHVATAYAAPANRRKRPPSISFWPHKTDQIVLLLLVVTISSTQ
jgi:hypothetical protein